MRKPPSLLALAALSLAVCVVSAVAQQEPDGWIREIEIVGLVPFEVSFRFENDSAAGLSGVAGTAILTDRVGQRIEQMNVPPFSVLAGESAFVQVGSRWEFQRPGIYLLEIALDLGREVLVSSALAFRILPVALPLAPERDQEGESLYTVYQQPSNWGLVRVSAPEAWAVSHGDADVVVAVIDSGIDRTIPQLSDSVWVNENEVPDNGVDDDRNGYVDDVYGWDFRDNDNTSLDGTPLHGHGTFVASIIAAQPGELPIVGVAPGARLMDVRFLDSMNRFRSCDWRMFVEAIEYAVDNGADIINLSIYANGRPPRYFEDALQAATARGVIIVGIAGNEGEAEVMYPGKYDSVCAVAATTQNDLLAGFSNRGPEVAVCAPGEGVTSFTKGGRASTQSGTSFAASHVSGVLALILSVAPDLSPVDAVDVLTQTAMDLGARGEDDWYGNGLVSALQSLLELRR
jgi:subtilisin family serine protease